MIKLSGRYLRADLGDITQKIGDKNSNKIAASAAGIWKWEGGMGK
jgi:hypothetical protein